MWSPKELCMLCEPYNNWGWNHIGWGRVGSDELRYLNCSTVIKMQHSSYDSAFGHELAHASLRFTHHVFVSICR